MATLKSPAGTVVNVSDDQAKRLQAQGWKPVKPAAKGSSVKEE